jgi:hypothetical protein
MWKIIKARTRNEFYKKVEKYEERGYDLIPASYTMGGGSTNYFYTAIMRRQD